MNPAPAAPPEVTPAAVAGAPVPFWKRLIGVLAMLALIVAAGGYLYYRAQLGSIRERARRELDTVADLKLGQLVAWREERINDARVIVQNPAITAEVSALIEDPENPQLRRQVQDWLQAMQVDDRYESLLLVDRQMRTLVGVPGDAPPPRAPLRATLATVFQTGEVILTDLHQPTPLESVHFDLVAPMFTSKRSRENSDLQPTEPIAAVVMRMRPDHFLYPLLSGWPVPSTTAETVLARRVNDEMVYLNPLRHYPGRPLTMRRSANQKDLGVAMAGRGIRGVHEATDYRSEPVLAALRGVPDTDWVLVAKMDLKEAYRDMAAGARDVALRIAVLLLSIGCAAVYIWRLQHEQVLRRTLGAERDARSFSERLALITRHANDIILLTDASLRIVEANDRALAAYQYPLHELRQVQLGDLRAPEARAQFEADRTALSQPLGAIYQTIHQRRDGTTFPVEVSGRFVEIGGQRHLLAIIRDITQRRAAETALRESEERHRLLFENNHAVMLLLEANTGVIVDANPAAAKFYGWSRETLRRMNVRDLNHLSAEAQHDLIQRARATNHFHFRLAHSLADGAIRKVEIFSGLVPAGGRELLFSIIHDITEREATQAALAERLEELRQWQAATLGRESRVLELKAEINQLLIAAGRPPRYASAQEGTTP